jgi:2-oxoglutarate ferredoxin oxidoreductase subunit gamma
MAKLLCLGAIRRDFKVVMTQTYGIEQRGGDSTGYVVVSDSPIGNPIVEGDADISVALSQNLYETCLAGTAPGGTVFVNSSLVEETKEKKDIKQISVPASEIAIQTGSVRCANIVMMGAVLAETCILEFDDIAEALKSTLGKKKPELLEMNLRALKKGMTVIKKGV